MIYNAEIIDYFAKPDENEAVDYSPAADGSAVRAIYVPTAHKLILSKDTGQDRAFKVMEGPHARGQWSELLRQTGIRASCQSVDDTLVEWASGFP